MKEIDEQILREKIHNFLGYVDYLKRIYQFFKNYSENLTIVFDNLKEKKEFYCILCFINEIIKEENYSDKSFVVKKENESKTFKFIFPDKKQEIKRKLDNYFLKKSNENKKEKPDIFDYYYTSEEERKFFNESEKKIEFNNFKINYEYSFNTKENNNEDLETKLILDIITDNC